MAVSVPTAAPAPSQASAAVVTTDIPARLDRLRWGRFHTLVVVALGITWILDGLEVTLAGAISPALKESPQLRFSNADVGLASSAYLAGAVVGALFFGWLTDRLGRKRQFLDRRRVGRGGVDRVSRSCCVAAGSGMALGLSDRGRAGPRHIPHAPVAAGIAALADDAWPRRGSGGGARSHRGRVPRPRPPHRGRTAAGDPAPPAPLHAAVGGRPHAVSCRAPAHPGGLEPDGGAGVLLQRDLLHLRAGADRLLRHRRRSCRLVSVAFRARKFFGTGASRPAVRHR